MKKEIWVVQKGKKYIRRARYRLSNAEKFITCVAVFVAVFVIVRVLIG